MHLSISSSLRINKKGINQTRTKKPVKFIMPIVMVLRSSIKQVVKIKYNKITISFTDHFLIQLRFCLNKVPFNMYYEIFSAY